MDRNEIVELLGAQSEQIRTGFGVRRLSLFGSMVRGEQQEHSDADFLVEFEGRATFDRYMGLKAFLENLLGCPVDLVTTKGVKPAMYRVVAQEAIRVA